MLIIAILVFCTLISLILQYRAEHAIENKGRKKRLALIISVITFTGFVINSFEQYFDTLELSKNIDIIKNDLSNSLNDRDSLVTHLNYTNKKLTEISSQMQPFLILATRKYPYSDSIIALKKLYNEIVLIKQEVKDITIQDQYIPLNKNLKEQVIANLKNSEILKNCTFLIEDWTGITTNRQFSQQLAEIIGESGFSVSKKDCFGVQGGYTPAPIEINVTPENRALFDEFIKLLSPIFFEYEPNIRPKQAMTENLIRLRIFGRARFKTDGKVSYY